MSQFGSFTINEPTHWTYGPDVVLDLPAGPYECKSAEELEALRHLCGVSRDGVPYAKVLTEPDPPPVIPAESPAPPEPVLPEPPAPPQAPETPEPGAGEA